MSTFMLRIFFTNSQYYIFVPSYILPIHFFWNWRYLMFSALPSIFLWSIFALVSTLCIIWQKLKSLTDFSNSFMSYPSPSWSNQSSHTRQGYLFHLSWFLEKWIFFYFCCTSYTAMNYSAWPFLLNDLFGSLYNHCSLIYDNHQRIVPCNLFWKFFYYISQNLPVLPLPITVYWIFPSFTIACINSPL